MSVKALCREVLLCEWNGPMPLLAKSGTLSGLSFFKLSWLFTVRNASADGEPIPSGETGDVPLGVCSAEAAPEMLSASSGASEPFRDRASRRLCFNLNFSIQLELRDF